MGNTKCVQLVNLVTCNLKVMPCLYIQNSVSNQLVLLQVYIEPTNLTFVALIVSIPEGYISSPSSGSHTSSLNSQGVRMIVIMEVVSLWDATT